MASFVNRGFYLVIHMVLPPLKICQRDATNTISQRHFCPYRRFFKNQIYFSAQTQCNGPGFPLGGSNLQLLKPLKQYPYGC